MTENNENKNTQSRKGLIIAFIVILLAINGVQFFLSLQNKETIATQHETIEVQKADISNMMTKLDSVETELLEKRKEIRALGGKVEELDALLVQIQKDKDQLLRERNFAVTNLQKYKDKVEALMGQLTISDEKISHLTAQRDSLFKFNQNLEQKMEQRNDSLKKLTFTQKELEEKVALASVLKAEDITVDALTDRGKVKEGPDLKARHIHKLRVSFNLAENKLAMVEGKDIYLRIVEPDGVTLYDSNLGGGMFVANGKEIAYTLKQNVLFENNRKQRVVFTYLKGSPFKNGTYYAELFSDGYKIGEKKFTVD